MARVNGITQYLPATHTTILTLLRKHSPYGTTRTTQHTSDIAYYLFYQPWKDERLNWPSCLTYSGRFTHISGHQSAAGRAWTEKVSRSITNIPPLCNATNQRYFTSSSSGLWTFSRSVWKRLRASHIQTGGAKRWTHLDSYWATPLGKSTDWASSYLVSQLTCEEFVSTWVASNYATNTDRREFITKRSFYFYR